MGICPICITKKSKQTCIRSECNKKQINEEGNVKVEENNRKDKENNVKIDCRKDKPNKPRKDYILENHSDDDNIIKVEENGSNIQISKIKRNNNNNNADKYNQSSNKKSKESKELKDSFNNFNYNKNMQYGFGDSNNKQKEQNSDEIDKVPDKQLNNKHIISDRSCINDYKILQSNIEQLPNKDVNDISNKLTNRKESNMSFHLIDHNDSLVKSRAINDNNYNNINSNNIKITNLENKSACFNLLASNVVNNNSLYYKENNQNKNPNNIQVNMNMESNSKNNESSNSNTEIKSLRIDSNFKNSQRRDSSDFKEGSNNNNNKDAQKNSVLELINKQSYFEKRSRIINGGDPKNKRTSVMPIISEEIYRSNEQKESIVPDKNSSNIPIKNVDDNKKDANDLDSVEVDTPKNNNPIAVRAGSINLDFNLNNTIYDNQGNSDFSNNTIIKDQANMENNTIYTVNNNTIIKGNFSIQNKSKIPQRSSKQNLKNTVIKSTEKYSSTSINNTTSISNVKTIKYLSQLSPSYTKSLSKITHIATANLFKSTIAITIYNKNDHKIIQKKITAPNSIKYDHYDKLYALCNANNNLYISGGQDTGLSALNTLLIIDLVTFNLTVKTMPDSMIEHSMIFVPYNYVFIIGGKSNKVTYYDIKEDSFFEWGVLHYKNKKPSLSYVDDKYLLVISCDEKELIVERSNLNEEVGWELIKVNLCVSYKELISCYDRKRDCIVFCGEVKNDSNCKVKNYGYFYKENCIREMMSSSLDCKDDDDFLERSFYNGYLFPNVKGNEGKYYLYNAEEEKFKVVHFDNANNDEEPNEDEDYEDNDDGEENENKVKGKLDTIDYGNNKNLYVKNIIKSVVVKKTN